MERKLFGLLGSVVFALAAAGVAQATPITFTVSGGNGTTSGVSIGANVTVTPSDTLAGTTFPLNPGETSAKFDFLDVSVSGIGAVAGLIDATLNFSTPDASANGVLGGFAVILGWASGGVLTVLNDPGPVAFGDGGLFDVNFYGFSSACLSCTSLKGTVQASVSLLRAPTTSVPEPATLSLLGAGLFAIGLARRRKRAAL